MPERRRLKGVGYWGFGPGAGSPLRSLPRPQSLVRAGWRADDLPRIAAYLRGGRVAQGWCGLAHCRFEGCDKSLGSTDLTDGEWLWPGGLEHYLLEHDVALPEEFIGTMAANGWTVPPIDNAEAERLLDVVDNVDVPFGDLTFWLEWSRIAVGESV